MRRSTARGPSPGFPRSRLALAMVYNVHLGYIGREHPHLGSTPAEVHQDPA